MNPSNLSCWVMTDGKVGMEIQCIGLAEALGITPVVKRIAPALPWRWLPPSPLWASLAAAGPGGDRLEPPFPDLLIASGRQSAGPAIALRKASGGRTFVVQIQDPKTAPSNFDLMIVPEHDTVRGDNVFRTFGSLNRVTRARLDNEATKFAPALAHLPRPLVTVSVGGSNDRYTLDRAAIDDLCDKLLALTHSQGVGLAVTPSRRTGAENEQRLRERLKDAPAVVWDGSGENPYFGYLGLADYLVVTCDSVNMVSEACATGKPVHVVMLKGGSAKFERFHDAMRAAGYTRPFAGALEDWSYTPLDETARAAAEVKRRLAERGKA
ncbi:MAG: mitochondrial fission ELM1 family protein [Alphaproteobacteria bacterium]|nr:mitochondrial fission ELM1 family protein [Alphaproteobacteria bacterium]